jgi:hypothetical protein
VEGDEGGGVDADQGEAGAVALEQLHHQAQHRGAQLLVQPLSWLVRSAAACK